MGWTKRRCNKQLRTKCNPNTYTCLLNTRHSCRNYWKLQTALQISVFGGIPFAYIYDVSHLIRHVYASLPIIACVWCLCSYRECHIHRTGTTLKAGLISQTLQDLLSQWPCPAVFLARMFLSLSFTHSSSTLPHLRGRHLTACSRLSRLWLRLLHSQLRPWFQTVLLMDLIPVWCPSPPFLPGNESSLRASTWSHEVTAAPADA